MSETQNVRHVISFNGGAPSLRMVDKWRDVKISDVAAAENFNLRLHYGVIRQGNVIVIVDIRRGNVIVMVDIRQGNVIQYRSRRQYEATYFK